MKKLSFITIIKWFVFIAFIPFTGGYWILRKSNWSKKLKFFSITVILVLLGVVIRINTSSELASLNNTDHFKQSRTEAVTENEFLTVKKTRLQEDIEQIQEMHGELQERYKLALREGRTEFDDEWITQFNQTIEGMKVLYDPEVIISSEKYSDSEKHIYLALMDLDTLWKEYELDLAGKENSHIDFNTFFNENISLALKFIDAD